MYANLGSSGTFNGMFFDLNENGTRKFGVNHSGVLASAGSAFTGASNYIDSETGANNAIAGAFSGSSVTIPPGTGLRVTIKLAHTLQAGANTFNYNGAGAHAIKSSRNPASDIATGYAAGGIITLIDNGASVWLDVSQ